MIPSPLHAWVWWVGGWRWFKGIPNGIFFSSPQRSLGINVITAGVEPLTLNKQ